MSFSSTKARKICRQVLGTSPSACAMALTPMGVRIFPRNRKIATARETAGTGRMRGALVDDLLASVSFFISKIISNFIVLIQ
jgi:hypothetical protein